MRQTAFLISIAAIWFFGAAPASLWAADPITGMARQMIRQIPRNEDKPTLAVLTFPYSRGRHNSGSALVSERLTTAMVQSGMPVMERRLLPVLLEERRFWETGAVDTESIKRAKKISGVDAVVIGTLTEMSEKETRVTARIVRMETGEILAAATADIPTVWNDPPRIPRATVVWASVPTEAARTEAIEVPTGKPRLVRFPPDDGGPPAEPEAEPPGTLTRKRLALRGKRYRPAPVPFVTFPKTRPMHGGVLP